MLGFAVKGLGQLIGRVWVQKRAWRCEYKFKVPVWESGFVGSVFRVS